MQAKKRKKQEPIVTANEIELPKTEKKKQVLLLTLLLTFLRMI